MLTPMRTLSLAQEMAPARQLVLASAAEEAASLSSLSAEKLDPLLLAASDAVAAYCGIGAVSAAPGTFARQQVAETQFYDYYTAGAAPRDLFLRLAPATLTSIAVDGVALDLDTVLLDPSGVIKLLSTASYRYWPAEKPIVVTYAAGYVTAVQKAAETPPTGPDLPADLERAVIIAAQHLYALQTRENFDVAAEVEEDSDAGRLETRYFNAGRMAALPQAAQALLAPYRRLV